MQFMLADLDRRIYSVHPFSRPEILALPCNSSPSSRRLGSIDRSGFAPGLRARRFVMARGLKRPTRLERRAHVVFLLRPSRYTRG